MQNDTFQISRAPAPKPDIVPSSCLYCNIHVDKCSMKVCGKSMPCISFNAKVNINGHQIALFSFNVTITYYR